jgi:molybdopterin-guanine dinucleotide biosynthesis protein B
MKLRPAVIAVLGSKKSGKTTIIERMTKELSKRGYRIAVVKHVPEPNFTIDTRGKDSWRFAQAGATTIITVADNEIATIKKKPIQSLSLDEILQKCRDDDAVFLEGLRNLTARNRRVGKIVVVKSSEEASEASEAFESILALAGPCSVGILDLKVPCVDVFENPKKLADIIQKFINREQKKHGNGD